VGVMADDRAGPHSPAKIVADTELLELLDSFEEEVKKLRVANEALIKTNAELKVGETAEKWLAKAAAKKAARELEECRDEIAAARKVQADLDAAREEIRQLDKQVQESRLVSKQLREVHDTLEELRVAKATVDTELNALKEDQLCKDAKIEELKTSNDVFALEVAEWRARAFLSAGAAAPEQSCTPPQPVEDKVLDQEHAAIKIQALARGSADRKKVTRRRQKSPNAQPATESAVTTVTPESSASGPPTSQDQEQAAIKIQALARGSAERKKSKNIAAAGGAGGAGAGVPATAAAQAEGLLGDKLAGLLAELARFGMTAEAFHQMAAANFQRADTNHSGKIDKAELAKAVMVPN
jgi:hypothetical protein